MILSKEELAAILQSRKLGPQHDLGQNFLVDGEILAKIVAAVDTAPTWGRQILEVGPGLGVLTDELVRLKSGDEKVTVVAVEQDRALAERLPYFLRDPSNLTVVPADFIQFDRSRWFQDEAYSVATNLPFGITNYFLNAMYTEPPRPRQIIAMLQREVAERVLAEAGDSARGLQSIVAEWYGTRTLVTKVPRQSFWPVPKVDAAVVRLTIDRPIAPTDAKIFRMIKTLFGQRRKTLHNSLKMVVADAAAADAALTEAQMNPQLRPQDLTLEQWQRLSSILHLC